ncbi:flotillin-like protein FloA [Humisphaera borealis]|uniref:Flotillin-like protein FloA n=1 Tax=Humisphaera borealis TaxID=2807512 RepID=A0A7M2X1X6_9BACT|nr:flotillin-like protein FloA [Humisphaera borealis]QOV91442.1 flotillin-like protein FloA [Humisphaera borealis]
MHILAEEGFQFGTVVAVFVGIVILILLAVLGQFMGIYIRAMVSGARVSLLDLLGMRLRKVNANAIVNARIQALRAGLNVTTPEMESHVLAGGDVQRVILAMIAANKANIELPWRVATGIDLAGRDILDAVQTSVNPKVIDVPNPAMGRSTIDAVAKNGIQLKVKARVTVRTNINQLVGGATEETIIARVGEGIVTSIGSAIDHSDVLENPDHISKAVLAKGLDANTAFTILSIDIADIDVGENIGAKLQADKAEADKKTAQAEAEKRRAMAIAQEQENIAEQAKNRALVVLAEAEVPRAMAEAFRSGNLGIMDYYKMKNMQADTGMREAIANPGDGVKG